MIIRGAIFLIAVGFWFACSRVYSHHHEGWWEFGAGVAALAAGISLTEFVKSVRRKK